jgi:type I restriction enzyme, S subunit
VDFDPVRAKAEGRDPGLPEELAGLFPDRLVESELGEIPEGWEVQPLGSLFEVGLGGAWGKDAECAKADVAVRCLRGIDCHDLAEGRLPDVPVRWLSARQVEARRLRPGVILVEGSGSFCGRSLLWRPEHGQFFGEPVLYSNFCKRLDPTCSPSEAIVAWEFLRRAYRLGEVQSFRTGTAFPNLDVKAVLANLWLCIPPKFLCQLYSDRVRGVPRLDLIQQAETLASVRDVLLPRLVSGELPVGV